MLKALVLSIVFCFSSFATTVVEANRVDASGNPASGTVTILLSAACTGSSGYVIPAPIVVKYTGGNFTVSLQDNSSCVVPGGFSNTTYSVTWLEAGGSTSEIWYVPASSSPVSVASVVVQTSSVISPTQITQDGATTNQALVWSGTVWAPSSVSGGSAIWGGITGTLSSQTDLQSALNAKQGLITTGTTSQYFKGDLSLATLNTTAVPEGSNLYFTNARAVSALAGLYQTPISTGTTSQYFAGDFSLHTFPTNLSSFTNGPGFLTANQTITISGGCSGSGTTSISLSCSGSMTWPSAPGIAVYAGSNAWGTSLTAPSGSIVGTTDSQTLTNKTLDGVSPATMAFVDPTSSIQTQLNGKQGTITLGTTSQYFKGDLSLGTFPTNLSSFTNGPGYLTANQSITFNTSSGDVSGSATGTTSLVPTFTVNGLKGSALPGLSTGNLRYNGSTWVFDSASYLTANQSISVSGGCTGSGTTSISLTCTGTVSSVSGNSQIGVATGTSTPALSIVSNSIGNAQLAAAQVKRSCVIDNDTQSSTALIAAQFSGACEVPSAATIVEVDVFGGTGVVGGTLTTTGTSSINLQKVSLNGGGTTTLLSGNLASVSGQACATPTASQTCINGLTSSSGVTISTTALSGGDFIRVSAATPDTTQTWYRVVVTWTVN